jgi:hypothetical protein
MKIKDWSKLVHKLAKEKGWWESEREIGTLHMLMVTEIAEATEEARKNNPPIYQIKKTPLAENSNLQSIEKIEYNTTNWCDYLKPEGELIELADLIIRVLDYCEYRGWDLEKAMKLKHEFNKTRSLKHGNKQF